MDDTLINLGAALPDTRPVEERNKDYKDDELAAASAREPFTHKRIKELAGTVFNQWYVGSCVPHGFLTALEYAGIITAKEIKSQLRAYRKRSNYPGEGSIAVDMWEKIKSGVSPNKDFPTPEKFREEQAAAMPLVMGEPVLKDRFNYFEITDPNRIAGYVAAGKPVPVFIYASKNEWAREYVDVRDNVSIGNAEVRHCVCLVPEGDFTEDGTQYFAVHDSAKFGNRHLRYVSLEFILKRTYYAARIEKKGQVEPVPVPPPSDKPTVPCELGDRGEAVLNLQAFLIADGKLAPQYATGYYGALTAKAVLWYQLSKWQQFTSTIPELLELKGEAWGPQSIGTLP